MEIVYTMNHKGMAVRKLTELSLLTALALIIFIVELRLPDLSPIQGVKLGLANIVTIYALYRFRAGEVFLIVTARVILGSLFSGNFCSLIYSISGAFLCLAGMIPLRKIIPENYIWLCSIAGAILHNTGQIITAVILMKTISVIAYYPVLIFSGCIAGAFTGICTQLVIKRLR